jgi:hypothetical protein
VQNKRCNQIANQAKACDILPEHKPKNGWENRTKAAKAIFEDLKSFLKIIIVALT